MLLIKLTESTEGKGHPVYVNADHITAIRPASNGSCTYVQTVAAYHYVTESIEKIFSQLPAKYTCVI